MSLIGRVYAQEIPDIVVPKPDNYQITDIGKLISSLASVALIVAALAVFAYLVWGGDRVDYIWRG